jgi:hypothetical protein
MEILEHSNQLVSAFKRVETPRQSNKAMIAHENNRLTIYGSQAGTPAARSHNQDHR